MNPKTGQHHTLRDAEQKNLIGQQPESNSSSRKLLLFIYKGSIYLWKIIANERLSCL